MKTTEALTASSLLLRRRPAALIVKHLTNLDPQQVTSFSLRSIRADGVRGRCWVPLIRGSASLLSSLLIQFPSDLSGTLERVCEVLELCVKCTTGEETDEEFPAALSNKQSA